jgi:uncharacterized membrane protein
MKSIKSYIAILLAILVIDGIWLGIIMKDFYLDSLAPVMRDSVIIWPLALFYFAYALAVLFAVIKPFAKEGIKKVAIQGAWLGFAGYMTFELVNYGLVAGWPFAPVFVDIVWGAVLTAAISAVGAWAYNK